ncbi:prepilin-type N-terminal cleavage/methylation domain-containing protein, partial [Candidatus Jorgensenbacteria bacterium]|nr:prepilin-type N-terminal cleavage/methylation domain-containing protein [Candidatus Jorgensenbacteria bacterium]
MSYSTKRGQTLIEVVIGLAIGAFIIGSAAIALTAMLRANITIQRGQSASALNQELVDQVRTVAGATWTDIYNLPVKGASSTYYITASGTTLVVRPGTEGALIADVRSGLMGRWSFDESTGTVIYDSSPNSNHGVTVGDPARAQNLSDCKVG